MTLDEWEALNPRATKESAPKKPNKVSAVTCPAQHCRGHRQPLDGTQFMCIMHIRFNSTDEARSVLVFSKAAHKASASHCLLSHPSPGVVTHLDNCARVCLQHKQVLSKSVQCFAGPAGQSQGHAVALQANTHSVLLLCRPCKMSSRACRLSSPARRRRRWTLAWSWSTRGCPSSRGTRHSRR